MFYKTLLKLCEKRCVSPKQVAEDIGLGNSASAYWKKGSIPRQVTLIKLAEYFNVSVEYLMTGNEELAVSSEKQKEAPEQAKASSDADDIMKIYAMLNQENQAELKRAGFELLKEQMRI